MKNITTFLYIHDVVLERKVLECLNRFKPIKVLCNANEKYAFLENIRLHQPEFLMIDLSGSHYETSLELLEMIQKPTLLIAISDKERVETLLEKGFYDVINKNFTNDLLIKKIYKMIRLVTALMQLPQPIPAEEPASEYTSKKKSNEFSHNFLFVKYKKLSEKVKLEEILFMRNNKNIIEIMTTSGKLFYHHSTLKKFYEKLPVDRFVKINNAVIVNYHKIDKIKNLEITIQGEVFNVTRVYAQALKKLLRL